MINNSTKNNHIERGVLIKPRMKFERLFKSRGAITSFIVSQNETVYKIMHVIIVAFITIYLLIRRYIMNPTNMGASIKNTGSPSAMTIDSTIIELFQTNPLVFRS